MTMLRALRVRLGVTDVGSLFALDDGRVYFRFMMPMPLLPGDRSCRSCIARRPKNAPSHNCWTLHWMSIAVMARAVCRRFPEPAAGRTVAQTSDGACRIGAR